MEDTPRYIPRSVGRGTPGALHQVDREHGAADNQPFQPLPAPTSTPPFHLDLAQVLPPAQMTQISAERRLVLHVVGDTGGINNPAPQHLVAAAMTRDITAAAAGSPGTPAALYILGDVVYFYGEAEHYFGQFYEPYAGYPAPILAIPGNHDGDLPPHPTVGSLAAYVENFDAASPHRTVESGDTHRDAMTQPNPYWTLTTPVATIIGLYSNVPDGGQLDDAQIAWLAGELTAADPDKALILTAHHPVYSADNYHGGSSYLGAIIDHATDTTGRIPDLVPRRARAQLPTLHPYPLRRHHHHLHRRRRWRLPQPHRHGHPQRPTAPSTLAGPPHRRRARHLRRRPARLPPPRHHPRHVDSHLPHRPLPH